MRLATRLLLASALALAAAPVAAATKGPLRVLFVGNSYTFVNDLPRIVEAVAADRGQAVETGMLAKPNYAIEDHYADGGYPAAIARDWDWVVLQQGPSSLPASQAHLAHWASRAADLARQHGVRAALFAAWPAIENAHTWPDAEASYQRAAVAAQACVMPVSAAWRHAGAERANAGIYANDGLHSTFEGSYLAALVIVDGLFPRPRARSTDPLETAATAARVDNARPCQRAK